MELKNIYKVGHKKVAHSWNETLNRRVQAYRITSYCRVKV